MINVTTYTERETGEVVIRRYKEHAMYNTSFWLSLGSCVGYMLQQLIVLEADDQPTRYIYRDRSASKELANLTSTQTLLILKGSTEGYSV